MSFEIFGMEIPTEYSAYKRILQKAKTPTGKEARRTALIAIGGIALVGSIGVFIASLMSLIPM